MLSYEELNDLIDSTSDNRIRRIAINLEMALNDWPTLNLCEPVDFINELEKSITGELTFKRINHYLNTLNPATDSWKMESLTSVLEMFETDETRLQGDLVSIINALILD